MLPVSSNAALSAMQPALPSHGERLYADALCVVHAQPRIDFEILRRREATESFGADATSSESFLCLYDGPARADTLRSLITSRPWHRLDAEDCHLSDDIVAVVAAMPHLTSLNISGNLIGDVGFRHFAAHPQLRVISICRDMAGFSACAALASMPQLLALDLSDNSVTDAAVGALCAVRGLRVLYLRRNAVGCEGAMALGVLPLLTVLDLSHNNVRREGLGILARSDSLRSLNLVGNPCATHGAIDTFKGHNIWTVFNSENDTAFPAFRDAAARFASV